MVVGRVAFIAAIVAMGLVGGGTAAAASSRAPADCSQLDTTLDIRVCLSKQYDAADAALNAAYREVMAQLRRSDQEAADGGDRAGTLRAAQRAWIPFRDASCKLAGAVAYGGTLAPVLELNCLVDITERRTRALREIGKEFRSP